MDSPFRVWVLSFNLHLEQPTKRRIHLLPAIKHVNGRNSKLKIKIRISYFNALSTHPPRRTNAFTLVCRLSSDCKVQEWVSELVWWWNHSAVAGKTLCNRMRWVKGKHAKFSWWKICLFKKARAKIRHNRHSFFLSLLEFCNRFLALFFFFLFFSPPWP